MKIVKKIWFSASHKLKLPYSSPCTNLHGHNYNAWITISSNELNKEGMIVDFAKIKKIIMDKYDHKDLNKVLKSNPTAENIALDIKQIIQTITPDDAKVNIVLHETATGFVEV